MPFDPLRSAARTAAGLISPMAGVAASPGVPTMLRNAGQQAWNAGQRYGGSAMQAGARAAAGMLSAPAGALLSPGVPTMLRNAGQRVWNVTRPQTPPPPAPRSQGRVGARMNRIEPPMAPMAAPVATQRVRPGDPIPGGMRMAGPMVAPVDDRAYRHAAAQYGGGIAPAPGDSASAALAGVIRSDAQNMGDLEGTELGKALQGYSMGEADRIDPRGAHVADDSGDVGVPNGFRAPDGQVWNGTRWQAGEADDAGDVGVPQGFQAPDGQVWNGQNWEHRQTEARNGSRWTDAESLFDAFSRA